MDRQSATRIEAIMREVCMRLNESVRLVREGSAPQEFQEFRRTIGRIMGAIFLDVQQPIYDQFPELTPDELKSPAAPSD